MKKTILAYTICLCLLPFCSTAGENRKQQKTTCDDDNYKTMLLFDELSGRMMNMMVPKTYQMPFHFRDHGSLTHIVGFQNWISIDRPPVQIKPGETHSFPVHILGFEGGYRPRGFFDYSVSMRKTEFTGGSCFIWNIPEWENVPDELKKQKELFIYSDLSNQVSWGNYKPSPHGNSILLDKALYNQLVHRMRHSAPEPFYAPQFMNEGNKNYRKTRLDLARYSDGRLQTSGDEYVFEILLDRSSGYLAVYMRYQNKDEPKDLDVSEIRAKINPDRLHAMVWDYWIYPNTQSSRKIISAKAEHDAKRPDKECSENEEDNVFTIRINQVFGTVRPIWELEIWDELGRRIKESRNAYILYFNDEDIQDLKKPAISQHYLVVTGQLYEEMEALRKAMEKKKKREEERETLKEMMAQ